MLEDRYFLVWHSTLDRLDSLSRLDRQDGIVGKHSGIPNAVSPPASRADSEATDGVSVSVWGGSVNVLMVNVSRLQLWSYGSGVTGQQVLIA